tara:strand:- start:239 stop:922 length:684 start_codon:yes stop_codon:yes gene_type:complete
MNKALDNLLYWLKWPAALLALVALPGLVITWLENILRPDDVDPWLPILAGVIGYALLWGAIFSRREAGSFLPTFFHELSHVFAAVCTFHRVGDLRAGWSSGGRVTIYGGTNWVILLAPYFLPIAPILGAAWLIMGPEEWRQLSLCGFGATMAFYVFSLRSDIHTQQTDLQEVGFLFAWCFLPSANLLVLGGLLTWVVGGTTNATNFIVEAYDVTVMSVDWLVSKTSH